ncbi:hypothetical protein MMC07_004779, partial [Pseudocyphellaria aurata]|nr:hypothetical protein [Pseudocyphellaria aurata]
KRRESIPELRDAIPEAISEALQPHWDRYDTGNRPDPSGLPGMDGKDDKNGAGDGKRDGVNGFCSEIDVEDAEGNEDDGDEREHKYNQAELHPPSAQEIATFQQGAGCNSQVQYNEFARLINLRRKDRIVS